MMKLKVLLQAALLLIFSACAAQAVTVPVNQVGRNPFYQPPLNSVNDLRYMMQTAQGDIRTGLYQAGYPELHQPLMAQFSQADIRQVDYRAGQTFIWMLAKDRRTGAVKVLQDMDLSGSGRLPAYEFSIYKDGMRYVFAVPFVCGNLALKEITPVSSGGRMGGCFGFGLGCTPLRFVADAGYLHMSDPADFLLLRAGIESPINDRLSLLAMVGGAPHLDGVDGTDAMLVDFLLQYDWFRFVLGNQWSDAFVGVGLGGWISLDGDDDLEDQDSDIDVIANIGARIAGRPDSFNTSLFFEARSGVDELDTLGEYGRFGAGLRFRF